MRRRRTEIDKRLKRLEKELSSVNNGLSSLVEKAPRRRKPAGGGAGDAPSDGGSPSGSPDGARFADYFSSNLQPSKPLRHERRIQRNKAIVMSLFVLMVLFWIVYRFFL